MLSIFNSNSLQYAEDHFNDIYTWVINRINEKRISAANKAELLSDLETILKGNPSDILKKSKKYNTIFPKKNKTRNGKVTKATDSRITYIFNYKAFRQKFGFKLAEKLKITCCPYCNVHYTTTHETTKFGRKEIKNVFPEYDHFYPVNLHPILALSFFNLIPSCNICNTHYKGGKNPHLLFHPYTKVKESHFNFKFYPEDYSSLIGKALNIKLDFQYNSSPSINKLLSESISFFDIKNVYEKNHSSLIKDVIDKRITYCDKYIQDLETSYKVTFDDAYRIIFESYFPEAQIHSRPFSKIKKDLYNDLNIKKHLLK